MVGLLGCERTLPAHVQLFIHQYLQVLLRRAALNLFIPQPVLILGVASTQVQDLALGLVEPHEVHTGPLLKLIQVPVDGISSLRGVNHTTELGVICKFAEGAFDPTVYVTDEDVRLGEVREERLKNQITELHLLKEWCIIKELHKYQNSLPSGKKGYYFMNLEALPRILTFISLLCM